MTQPRLVLVRYVSLDLVYIPRVYECISIVSLLDCMCIVVFVVVFIFILEMFNKMFNRRDVVIEYPWLGDLTEERNRVYVSQWWGAQQRQEASWRRHRKRTLQPVRRESTRRGELLREPPLSSANTLAVAPWAHTMSSPWRCICVACHRKAVVCRPARHSAVVPLYSRIGPARDRRSCLRARHQRSRAPTRRHGPRPPCQGTPARGPVASPCLPVCPSCAVSSFLSSPLSSWALSSSQLSSCALPFSLLPSSWTCASAPVSARPATGAYVGAEAHKGVASLVVPVHGRGAEP